MSPFPLSAGVPPVATTVAAPAVRVTTNVLLAACVGLTSALLIVDELVYVIELAALVEYR
jgi:hypothetical protein